MKKVLLILFGIIIISCTKEKKYDPVTACFRYDPTEVVTGEVQFTNCSVNATDYIWNFGDGSGSTEKEPKHTFQGKFPFKVQLIAYNEVYSDTMISFVYDQILVKKPNIYLYAENKMDVCVNIEFPLGGKIVKSIPEYDNGWCVNIDKNGKIDGQYDYLFYESKQPNLFQRSQGWCIKKEELSSFFKENMSAYNFSEREIKDFTDYWIPKLQGSSYYLIYPQTNDIIAKTNRLRFSVEPDNVFRLFYSIKGTNKFINIKQPVITPINNRKGFYIVEWGVMKD